MTGDTGTATQDFEKQDITHTDSAVFVKQHLSEQVFGRVAAGQNVFIPLDVREKLEIAALCAFNDVEPPSMDLKESSLKKRSLHKLSMFPNALTLFWILWIQCNLVKESY